MLVTAGGGERHRTGLHEREARGRGGISRPAERHKLRLVSDRHLNTQVFIELIFRFFSCGPLFFFNTQNFCLHLLVLLY